MAISYLNCLRMYNVYILKGNIFGCLFACTSVFYCTVQVYMDLNITTVYRHSLMDMGLLTEHWTLYRSVKIIHNLLNCKITKNYVKLYKCLYTTLCNPLTPVWTFTSINCYPTLQPHHTVNFNLIDFKSTQQASYSMCRTVKKYLKNSLKNSNNFQLFRVQSV